MIRDRTVFILGAGSSCHYGYPTGEGLVDTIIEVASSLSTYCDNRIKSGQVVQIVPKYIEAKWRPQSGTRGAIAAWEEVRSECEDLVRRIKVVRPLIIDYFLAWNDLISGIGKLIIAAAILECESNSVRGYDRGDYVNKDWYRFLVHRLVVGCKKSSDIFENSVTFVTFNYDMSLEYYLFQALSFNDIFNEADVETFLRERIVHVYGSIRSAIPRKADFFDDDYSISQMLGNSFQEPLTINVEFGSRKTFLDKCLPRL